MATSGGHGPGTVSYTHLDVYKRQLQQTEAALRQLAQNGNARLVLENVLLTYPQA